MHRSLIAATLALLSVGCHSTPNRVVSTASATRTARLSVCGENGKPLRVSRVSL